MKSFLVALLVLFLILSFTIFSSLLIKADCDTMLSLLSSFPDEISSNENPFMQFDEAYNKIRSRIRSLVGHTESDLIEDAFTALTECYRTHNQSGYHVALRQLYSAVERVRNAQFFTFDTIL